MDYLPQERLVMVALAACGGESKPTIEIYAQVGSAVDTANPGVGSDNYQASNRSFHSGEPQESVTVSRNEFFYVGCWAKPLLPNPKTQIQGLVLRVDNREIPYNDVFDPRDIAKTYAILAASEYQVGRHRITCEATSFEGRKYISRATVEVVVPAVPDENQETPH